MKVTYPGPHASVFLNTKDGQVICKQGQTIEVTAEQGHQLVAQGWDEATIKKGQK